MLTFSSDEISALVLDPGWMNVRAGFAGEDVPKSVVPSHYGDLSTKGVLKLVFGDNAIHTPTPGMEIRNSIGKDGTVEDWDTAAKVWEYAITSRLTNFKPSGPINHDEKTDRPIITEVEMEGVEDNEKPLEENPLLMTETAWNPIKSRERAIEVAMESWGCPAFWLARNSVLAAFAAGKASALVVDVGATSISITPIHDGLILKKGIQRSPMGGNWLSSQLRTLFNNSDPKVDLTPHFMIASKTPVDAGAPAQATYRTFDTPPTATYRALQEERILTEFKESVVQVWPGPGRLSSGTASGTTNEDFAKSQPGRVFEMPDGANQMWGVERFKVAEGMWDEKAALPMSLEAAPTKAQTIPEMVKAAVSSVDMDLRVNLLQNVVVTGGTTLLNGFNDRLVNEIQAAYPGARIRIQAPGLTAERKFGTWIGGSILGSLGTFHQMWISKKEYDEFGPNVVEKRCK
jgi:actin-related protein 4